MGRNYQLFPTDNGMTIIVSPKYRILLTHGIVTVSTDTSNKNTSRIVCIAVVNPGWDILFPVLLKLNKREKGNKSVTHKNLLQMYLL